MKKIGFWSRQHAIGFAIGILTILVAIPLVAFLLKEFTANTGVWRELKFMPKTQERVLSLAALANLVWFHIFLRKEQWRFGYGIIYATVLAFLIILALKFNLF
ncbi:MAG TPA: hypothetical protein PLP27_13275 [Crocinitomicaceae bacterium]|nr:hypothetical protein [Crocinitomicaceae bacterium]